MATTVRMRRIARRTLRLKARRLDETVHGHPVVLVGDHRVVLPDGAHHFRPLLDCNRCEARFVAYWYPILRRADLDHPVTNALCERCMRTVVQEEE